MLIRCRSASRHVPQGCEQRGRSATLCQVPNPLRRATERKREAERVTLGQVRVRTQFIPKVAFPTDDPLKRDHSQRRRDLRGLFDEGVTVAVIAKTSPQPRMAPGAPIARPQSARRHRGCASARPWFLSRDAGNARARQARNVVTETLRVDGGPSRSSVCVLQTLVVWQFELDERRPSSVHRWNAPLWPALDSCVGPRRSLRKGAHRFSGRRGDGLRTSDLRVTASQRP